MSKCSAAANCFPQWAVANISLVITQVWLCGDWFAACSHSYFPHYCNRGGDSLTPVFVFISALIQFLCGLPSSLMALHRLPPFIDDSRSGCTHCVIMSAQVLLCLSALPLALSSCIWNGAFPPIDPLPGGVAGRLIRLVPACLPSEWTHRESCVHVPGFAVLCSPRQLVAEWSLWLPPYCPPSRIVPPFCIFVVQ